MKWQFQEFPNSLVETEVTQRDQFRNDEVDLADTLIRETVQNSLDARTTDGTQVRVCFKFLEGEKAPESAFVRQLFEGQLQHAEAAGIALDSIDLDHPRAVIIEDFGTKGLMGDPFSKADDDFSDFWRRHGISHKSGARRGRWGLGKLVFSTSSVLRAFFGLTVRSEDPTPLIMGQTVLSMHRLDGRQYPPHTHFADVLVKGPEAGLRVPISDPEFVRCFSAVFQLSRSQQSGLSITIPFPHPDLERKRMVEAAIRHYFIPVLREQLILEFDDLELNSRSLLESAREYLSPSTIHDMDALFEFVRATDSMPEAMLITLDRRWYRDGMENAIDPDELLRLRRDFAEGSLIGVRFPLDVVRKDGTVLDSEVRGFLMKPAGLSRGQDHYVRSGITVPQESKFGHRNVLGLLLADDSPISEFLGDSENPAHTLWIGNAEKVQTNYRGAQSRVTAIKKCLVNLHDLLAQAVEERAEEALLDFFWTLGMGTGPRPGNGKEDFPPRVPPRAERQPFRIGPINGGFTVRVCDGAAHETLPTGAVITAAYDVDEGNPFRLWSEFDFDFARVGEAKIVIFGAKVEARGNTIRCIDLEPSFQVSVTGLDERRDLIVKVESA